jgi:hypothetical protein
MIDGFMRGAAADEKSEYTNKDTGNQRFHAKNPFSQYWELQIIPRCYLYYVCKLYQMSIFFEFLFRFDWLFGGQQRR